MPDPSKHHLPNHGRRHQRLGEHSLMDHIRAVLDLLPVGPSHQRAKNSDLTGWIIDAWKLTISQSDGRVPKDEEHVRDILNGRKPINATHLQHLHHVLGLHDFELGWHEVWLEDEPESPRLRNLTSFKEKVVKAGEKPHDPLRLIEHHADAGLPWIGVQVSTQPQRAKAPYVSPQIIGKYDEAPLAQPDNAIKLRPGKWVELQFMPAFAGYILLIERRHAIGEVKERIQILNDFHELGLERDKLYEKKPFSSQPFLLTKICTKYTLACINWPAELNPEEFGLKGLFKKNTDRQGNGKIDHWKLRNIGLAVKYTAEGPAHLRVRAGVQILVVDQEAKESHS